MCTLLTRSLAIDCSVSSLTFVVQLKVAVAALILFIQLVISLTLIISAALLVFILLFFLFLRCSADCSTAGGTTRLALGICNSGLISSGCMCTAASSIMWLEVIRL